MDFNKLFAERMDENTEQNENIEQSENIEQNENTGENESNNSQGFFCLSQILGRFKIKRSFHSYR